MPKGMYKSRTFRRVKVKVPGNTTKLQYRRRKPSKAICTNCKKVLTGMPNAIPRKLSKLPKTARRPERPYGGVLCSSCTRLLLKHKARE